MKWINNYKIIYQIDKLTEECYGGSSGTLSGIILDVLCHLSDKLMLKTRLTLIPYTKNVFQSWYFPITPTRI